jgi:hypothetical protein
VASGGAIPAGAQGVDVDVARVADTFFMRVVGINTVDVRTSGTALTARQDSMPAGLLLPIAMSPPENMTTGEIYDITDGKDGPGNFGWLSWDGSNDANTLVNSICTPNNPPLTVPVDIDGAPGKMNKKAGRDCLDEYIANGTRVLIPLWDGSDVGNGSHAEYHIIGFAAFILTDRSQPAVDNIQGAFQEYYPILSVSGGFGTEPQPGDATYFIGLIR